MTSGSFAMGIIQYTISPPWPTLAHRCKRIHSHWNLKNAFDVFSILDTNYVSLFLKESLKFYQRFAIFVKLETQFAKNAGKNMKRRNFFCAFAQRLRR